MIPRNFFPNLKSFIILILSAVTATVAIRCHTTQTLELTTKPPPSQQT